MYPSAFKLAVCILAAGRALASEPLQPRQAADAAAFTSAISALVSSYLPPDVYARVTATIPALVPAAENTAAPDVLLVSALAASPPPPWLAQAFGPDAAVYQSGLTAGVDALRPGAAPPAPPAATATAPTATTTAAATTTTTTAPDGSASPSGTDGAAASSSSSKGHAAAPAQTLAAVGAFGMAGLLVMAI